MNLNGNIGYQSFQWFDKTQTPANLVDTAKNIPSAAGITTSKQYQINPDVCSIVLT